VFHNDAFITSEQYNTSSPPLAIEVFTGLFQKYSPTEVLMEDYRVYSNRTEQHAGSSLSTPRLIGMLETLCMQFRVPWHKQPAAMPKQFVTDEKLKAWKFYQTGKQHSRDAIRHGCYFILFPPKELSSRQITSSRTTGRHVG